MEIEVNGVLYIFRRGFVAELRVPTLAVLLGGACGRCGGSGRLHSETDAYGYFVHPCSACGGGDWQYDARGRVLVGERRGTGTTPGLAAAVFREHPVTRVEVAELADAEPLRGPYEEGDGPPFWLWIKEGPPLGRRMAWEIPDAIWSPELAGTFDSEDAAREALNAAIVDACRSRAGLGPLS